MYIKCLFIILLSTIAFTDIYAQDRPTKAPESLRQRVNTIDSFINRFNYEEDQVGNLIASPESASVAEPFIRERSQQIISLFDLQSKGIKKELLEEFLASVNSPAQQTKLDFYDKQWFAEVQMDVLYKQKPQKITLILQVEETEPKTSRWVIRTVKESLLKVKTTGADSTEIIPPNSHSTDFIGLPLKLSTSQSATTFAAQDLNIDPLSVFLYAVQNGEIKFKQTSRVSFHFLQLDNWILRVEEVNRPFPNSGWLVTELIKADTAQKSQYAAKQLNIH